jgi:hypothetical protein
MKATTPAPGPTLAGPAGPASALATAKSNSIPNGNGNGNGNGWAPIPIAGSTLLSHALEYGHPPNAFEFRVLEGILRCVTTSGRADFVLFARIFFLSSFSLASLRNTHCFDAPEA